MIAASQYSDNVSQFAVFITFMLTFVSAWFTEAAGVHAIFGAFLAGLIIPHDHGFAIKVNIKKEEGRDRYFCHPTLLLIRLSQVTEKIEDLVSILFLPLYFAYSGLNTRIDQLDNGVAWGMIFLVIGVACVGKILGVFVAAKVLGIGNRESLAVGVLMNTSKF